ncbi:MAG: TolC family protein, partial [Gemmatimonadales bacterium]
MAPDSPRRAPRAAALLLALLCLPNPLGAQQKLTLQDAIALARKQSHQALAARDARDASRHRTGAFNARLLPQLSLSGTVPAYNRSIIQVVQPDGTTLFRPQQQTNAALTATLSQKLPFTGGDLFVSSSLSRLTVSGQQSVETWSSTPVRFGLRQDIFRPNTLSWDRKEQSIDSELRERLYLEAMEDVAIQTTQAFFDMYTARTAFDNAVTNAAVNDTLYTLNKGRYEVGKIGENDLLQSELALLRARTSVEQARLQYERTTAALRLAL